MVPLVVGNLRRMEVMWCFPPYDPPPHCASAAPTRPKSATIKHMCTISKVKHKLVVVVTNQFMNSFKSPEVFR